MSLQKWDRSRLVHLHEHGQFTVSEVAKFIDKLLTTAAQEKEEAVAEVVERWRKSIDDEGRSCSVKIEEAVKYMAWCPQCGDALERVGTENKYNCFGCNTDYKLSISTPPKNISSNETTV